MADLKSKRWIVAKGGLFLLLAVLSAGLIFEASPTLTTAGLLVLLGWSSARFYYFLFYVLENYVDPTLRYSGIIELVRAIWRRGSNRS